MTFLVNSIIVFIIAVFPTLLSTFYVIYTRSLDKKERSFCIDVGIIFTQYILVLSKPKQTILIASIPFLISLFEKRKLACFCCAFILVYLSKVQYNINLIYIIFEYILLLSLLILYEYKKISKNEVGILYIIIKLTTFLLLTLIKNPLMFPKYKIFLISITFILAVIIFSNFYDKCKSSTKLFMTLKDIEENKQIKQALFTISHEIKNPLAVCKGYLDMYDYNDVNNSRKYVPIIKSEIDKTLDLLQDFLHLSKISLKKDILDINYLIDDCLDNLDLLLKNRNIKIIKDLIDDELFIYADYNRLYQVFVNIIKNAVEAMEDEKEKTIIIKDIVLKDKIMIKFTDSGKGIDKELLNKIGEPFYTSKSNGTGLGIAFSTEIITSHGGSIKFTSEDLKGTTVQVILPIGL